MVAAVWDQDVRESRDCRKIKKQPTPMGGDFAACMIRTRARGCRQDEGRECSETEHQVLAGSVRNPQTTSDRWVRTTGSVADTLIVCLRGSGLHRPWTTGIALARKA